MAVLLKFISQNTQNLKQEKGMNFLIKTTNINEIENKNRNHNNNIYCFKDLLKINKRNTF